MTAAELVDRVARDRFERSRLQGEPIWGEIADRHRARWKAEVADDLLRVLAAIRDPTDSMIIIGDAELYHGDVIDPAHVFRAMCDALAAEIMEQSK